VTKLREKRLLLEGCPGYFEHPFAKLADEKSFHGVLHCIEEECIMLMSAKPRENLPSWHSENFCLHVQKKHVKTFVIRA
jgi:hypothetical protein